MKLKKNQWKPEDIEIIKQNVNHKSHAEIAKMFKNRSSHSINNICSQLKIKSSYVLRKKFLDNNFFSNPNILNTYYAAFLAADGYLSEKNSVLKIQLNPKDIELLENFKKDIKFTGEIKVFKRKKYKKEDEFFDVCSIDFTSKQVILDLKNNFNVIENKTKRLGPPLFEMNKLLKMAYLIGYLDGDGSINFTKRAGNYYQSKIGIYSSSFKIMNFIKETIKEIFNIDSNIKLKKDKFVYEMSYYDNKALKIIYWLKKINVPKLSRKWNNPILLDKLSKFEDKFKDNLKNPLIEL